MRFLFLLCRIKDFSLTVILWAYFLFGYLVLLPLFFIPYYAVCRNVAAAFQKIHHRHLKTFFNLARRMIPRVTYDIDPRVSGLTSSILVCNHVSYLDPILLVSLFPRQTTIVKNSFFRVPVFGFFLKKAGYVPSSPEDMQGASMIRHLDDIKDHLAAGGNLFVFPEGTRGRDGKLAPFARGVFSIARYCRADLKLVFLRNTDKLFRPGRFSFHTCETNVISVELMDVLKPDYAADDFSIREVSRRAWEIFADKMARTADEGLPDRIRGT